MHIKLGINRSMDASVSRYAEHLTPADLRLLTGAADLPDNADFTDPALVEALLADPRVFEAVFGSPAEVVLVSPFLAFGVAVHRAVLDLASLAYLPERSGMRQVIPVFDAPELRDFLGSAQRRLFLAELLASFTRIASGRYREPSRWDTGRPAQRARPGAPGSPGAPGGVPRPRPGGRTRRYSELDPVRLAGLLDVVPEQSRPGVYRRLGDVSLFLTGVFPDYAVMHALGPVDASRLLRAARVPAGERGSLEDAAPLDLLEYLGARWYRAAFTAAPVRTAPLDVVGEVAERFRQARRVLNHLADSYLIGSETPWFPRPGAN
jgi:hypothetical protein